MYFFGESLNYLSSLPLPHHRILLNFLEALNVNLLFSLSPVYNKGNTCKLSLIYSLFQRHVSVRVSSTVYWRFWTVCTSGMCHWQLKISCSTVIYTMRFGKECNPRTTSSPESLFKKKRNSMLSSHIKFYFQMCSFHTCRHM